MRMDYNMLGRNAGPLKYFLNYRCIHASLSHVKIWLRLSILPYRAKFSRHKFSCFSRIGTKPRKLSSAKF